MEQEVWINEVVAVLKAYGSEQAVHRAGAAPTPPSLMLSSTT